MNEVNYKQVPAHVFMLAYVVARDYETIRANTSTPTEIHKAGKFEDSYFLAFDSRSGFIITGDGELKAVFSLVKGRGDGLVSEAVKRGATHLDCFEGYLTRLYAKHGFGIWKIEPNWTPGGPAVHYMRQGARSEQEAWLDDVVQGCMTGTPATQ